MKRLALVSVMTAFLLALAGCSTTGALTPAPSTTMVSEINQQARAALPADVRKSGVLRVATDATYAPNEFVDANDKPVGWEIELIKRVAVSLGLKAEVTQVTFDEIFGQLESGQQDLGISSFFDNSTRHAIVDMVDYYTAGTQWGQRKGSSVDPNNACGLKIAVQKDSYQFDVDLPARSKTCVDNGRSAIKILSYNTQDAANEAVEFGQAAAFVSDSPVTQFAVLKSGGTFTTAGDVYDTSLYGMPVKKGSKMVQALTLALQDLMDKDTYRQILSSWGVQSGAISKVTVNAGK